jgi:hypothetical protein
MSPNNENIEKALRAFLATYRLKPVSEGPQFFYDEVYIKTFEIYSSEEDEKNYQLQLSRQEHDHLINILQDKFPGQLHRNKLKPELLRICKEWIENDYDISANKKINEIAKKLISSIKSSISTFEVLIPIQGLEVKTSEPVRLSKCLIKENRGDSKLQAPIKNLERRYEGFNNLEIYMESKSFAECSIHAQKKKAVDSAIDLVNQSLDILRLFRGSYYFDLYSRKGIQTKMGIAGTFSPEDRGHAIILDPEEDFSDQIPSTSTRVTHDKSFEINKKLLESMNNLGLQKINNHLEKPYSKKKDHISRRLLRAIRWFAKATTANSLGDSFMFYSISVEALLSEGRTSQNTYSNWIAALVSQDSEKILYPLDGARSKEFSKKLYESKNLSEKFLVVKEHCLNLFDYRNDIAHGAILDNNIDPVILLDLETLSRNTILAFINGPWHSIKEFKKWYEQSTWIEFSPK